MNKEAFLNELKKGLSGLPQDDVAERLAFYGEMIDDRMEEGLDEEAAVAAAGSVEAIVRQTLADIPLTKLVKEKVAPKRKLRVWEIVLIVLGSPVWGALLVAAAAVLLSLYAVVWVLIVSLWAVETSLWAGALGGVALAVAYFVQGYAAPGILLLGGGLLLAGIALLLFFGCVQATRGLFRLTRKMILWLKARFVKKEAVK